MRYIFLFTILAVMGPVQLCAAPDGLDSSLQLLKQQALELERDLLILEEQVDNPLVIYLSMNADHKFRLESLHILLDGKSVKDQVYDSNLVGALRKGGAQLVYQDRLAPGPHEIIAYYRTSRDYQRGAKLAINKTLKPEFIEIIIQQQPGTESRAQPELLIREWEQP